MCLTVRLDAQLYLAKKPILVWKHLYNDGTNRFVSPYRGKRYRYGKVYESQIKFDTIMQYQKSNIRVGVGLHSFSRRYTTRFYTLHELIPAVIPTGAYFVKGRFCREPCIASTHLQILKPAAAIGLRGLRLHEHKCITPLRPLMHQPWIVK